MYELSLGAPTGDLLIGLKPEAAEAVKMAVLDALKKHLAEPKAAPAVVKTSRPRERAQTPPAIGEPAEAPQAATGAPAAPRADVLGRHRAGFRVLPEVKVDVLRTLPGSAKPADSLPMATARVNILRFTSQRPEVSTSTVGRALAALAAEGAVVGAPGIVEGASPKAWGWRLAPREPEPVAESGVGFTPPPDFDEFSHGPAAFPQVSVGADGFQVTLAAGEGVVKGAA